MTNLVVAVLVLLTTKIWQKERIKAVINLFFENHLFDIVYGTDTHKWLPVEDYDFSIKNLKHGVLYMASWTSVVFKSTN